MQTSHATYEYKHLPFNRRKIICSSLTLRNIQFSDNSAYKCVDDGILDDGIVIMRQKMFVNVPHSTGLVSSSTLKTATEPPGISLTGRRSARRPTSTRHGLERAPATFVCTAVTRRLSFPRKQASRKLPNRSRTLKVRALSASWGRSVQGLLLWLKMFNDYPR